MKRMEGIRILFIPSILFIPVSSFLIFEIQVEVGL
jgi:hypothetical protein